MTLIVFLTRKGYLFDIETGVGQVIGIEPGVGVLWFEALSLTEGQGKILHYHIYHRNFELVEKFWRLWRPEFKENF